METNYHMSVLVHEQAKKYGDREMLIYQDFGGKEWKSLIRKISIVCEQ